MQDMTKGAITPHMLRFLAPMVAGNILQQLYNAVASIAVGRYCGEIAFAAIGVAAPIMNLAIFIIIGMCMGASVLMSEMYGAGRHDMLRLEFSSSVLGGSANALDLCVSYLRSIALFYVIAGTTSCFQGYFRGIGRLTTTLAASATQITLRVVITWLAAPAYGIQSIAFATGIGWIVAQIMLALICRVLNRNVPAFGFKQTGKQPGL